jgi:hypothetical protein
MDDEYDRFLKLYATKKTFKELKPHFSTHPDGQIRRMIHRAYFAITEVGAKCSDDVFAKRSKTDNTNQGCPKTTQKTTKSSKVVKKQTRSSKKNPKPKKAIQPIKTPDDSDDDEPEETESENKETKQPKRLVDAWKNTNREYVNHFYCFGCHKALHTSHFTQDQIDQKIRGCYLHPVIVEKPKEVVELVDSDEEEYQCNTSDSDSTGSSDSSRDSDDADDDDENDENDENDAEEPDENDQDADDQEKDEQEEEDDDDEEKETANDTELIGKRRSSAVRDAILQDTDGDSANTSDADFIASDVDMSDEDGDQDGTFGNDVDNDEEEEQENPPMESAPQPIFKPSVRERPDWEYKGYFHCDECNGPRYHDSFAQGNKFYCTQHVTSTDFGRPARNPHDIYFVYCHGCRCNRAYTAFSDEQLNNNRKRKFCLDHEETVTNE